MRRKQIGLWAAAVMVSVMAGRAGAQPVAETRRAAAFAVDGGFMKLEVVADDIIHVMVAKDKAFFEHASLAVLPGVKGAGNLDLKEEAGVRTLRTPKLSARVDAKGNITFLDAAGKVILAEKERTFEPAEVLGEKTYHVRQQWAANADESLFGLGQHQFGLVDIKGYDFELWQHNTEIAVPFLVSSKGYGIFWDNNSATKFGDPREYAAIPADHLTDATGAAGGFTATVFGDAAFANQTGQRVDKIISNEPAAAGGRAGNGGQSIRWEGQVTADFAGDYQFALYANGGFKMWIDDKLVSDHWRQNWLPWDDLAKVHFEAKSKHKIKVEWVKDGGAYCSLTWKPPVADETAEAPTSLMSQVGDGVDYYFVYGGPDAAGMARVLAGYRQLTGKAPMMPQWAFGLWQSRQRYETQQASIDVVKGFRQRQIPFDNIVQDWFYWKEDSWGSHEFDPARFPNPDQWVKDIHDLNAHIMISVWGKFYPTTENAKAMQAKGFLYPVDTTIKDWVGRGYQYTFFDAFNPEARTMFWNQVNDKLFSKHFDAWWMDATEPDLNPSPPTLDRQISHMPVTALGSGAKVLNAYPLMNSKGVYEGQRAAAPDQRVFILTRSGYAGQQRYAAAVWSGDISSSWTAMKKQIAAGLGASISGLPYWTMDSGGFSVPAKFAGRNPTAAAVDEWRESNARWFEFAAFVPLLRVHGEAPFREMWQFGGETSDAYKAMLKTDRLRYRLLPYVYSLAGDVTQNDGTFMRPLVMDFPDDRYARAINDQYMFGPAFLVSPVTTYKARTRSVYLPKIWGGWYDFWTGKFSSPGVFEVNDPRPMGMAIDAPAPYDQMPLHVQAGSIIPLGPYLQYVAEKKPETITLMVYTGADGAFSLYEDDGLTYQYEKGASSRIELTWNDKTRTLTIGKRAGSFAGMLKERTFDVVFVSAAKPVGFSFTPKADKSVKYTGDAVEVKME